jgi:UDP-N-acetylmuramyl pentapeptide phosphotransferase/UDP-N-acetylglucosamine-1-phosphate transferase
MLMPMVIAGLVAWLLARWVTGVAGAWGARRGIVSQVTERSSHVRPTSRLGGFGLAAGVVAGGAIWLVWWLVRQRAIGLPGNIRPLLVLLAAGWLIIFICGLLDDLYDLPPLLKLALLLLGSAVGAFALRDFLPCAGAPCPGLLGGFAALVWIVFFVNAYNFMDGMDGFAGNFARWSALGFLAAATLPWGLGDAVQSAALFAGLPLVVAAAATGFLAWNRPPAKYFMGDAGSLSTGYVLACLALVGAQGRLGAPVDLLAGQIILLPFTFDVVLTLIRRLRHGENILKAHRSHLYQRLMISGLTHPQVLRLNIMLFVACAALGVFAARLVGGGTHGFVRLVPAMLALGLMFAYWQYTLRRERPTPRHLD